jgi:tetratricopeptide (TPR) repeat protein
VSASRTLKIRCATWDQVEGFYSNKIKPDRTLVIRVPFNPKRGDGITLALALPNELVMAIDGTVEAAKPAPDNKRAQVKLKLHGLTDDVIGRLEALVADSRGGQAIADPFDVPTLGTRPPLERHNTEPPPAEPMDAPVDEVVEQPGLPTVSDVASEQRDVFLALEETHRTLREAAAHDVLGVSWDASVDDIRRGYFELTKQYHPDTFAKYRSEAVLHLAEEVFIHVNKAYDRMRDAAAERGQAIIAGPALLAHNGWVAGFEDVEDTSARRARARDTLEPDPLAAGTERASQDFFDPGLQGLEPLEVTDSGPVTVSFGPGEEPRAKRNTLSDDLFSDIDPPSDRMEASAVTESSQASSLFATRTVDKSEREMVRQMEAESRELIKEGAFEQAIERLAAALHIDARNRPLRALYHVANGHSLEDKGREVDAMTQYETALRHDPDCQEARAALEARDKGRKKKGGLFKRLFKE